MHNVLKSQKLPEISREVFCHGHSSVICGWQFLEWSEMSVHGDSGEGVEVVPFSRAVRRD